MRPTIEAFGGPGNDQRLLIYENYESWPGGINIGFQDGHVEWVDDQQRAERLIQAEQNP